ncbi:diguanylate cyclase domain-containing protein [Massilia sp.]|uniref:diguanylate cyclase domain-containing protein n=1 Tax=Massilia sp. TaxID=1882437 RepID=UPI00391A89D4
MPSPAPSCHFLAAFARSAVGMALLDLQGRWLEFNEALCTFLAYPRAELLALSYRDVTHPADLEADLAFLERMLAGELDSYCLEKRYRRPDAAVVWGLLTVTLCRDDAGRPECLIAQVIDITAQKKAIEDRDALFALAPDLLSISSPDAYIMQVNPAWRDLLGWDEAVLMSRPFVDFLHPDDRARTLEKAGELASGGAVLGFRNRYRHADGGWRWIEWSTRVASDGRMFCSGRDVTEQIESEEQTRRLSEELHYRATHDFLTGLPNRYEFTGRLQQVLGTLPCAPRPVVLMFIDLDGFKAVNDICGHAAGDAVLVAFGRRLLDAVRQVDTVARLAGDEFVVLLDRLHTPWPEALQVAQRILRPAARPYPETGGRTQPGATIGMALHRPGESADQLRSRADAAMYTAKNAGKNCAAYQHEGQWVLSGA